jgi:di- and tripeptidase
VAHEKGIILSSLVTEGGRDFCLVTGGNDDYVKVRTDRYLSGLLSQNLKQVWEASVFDTGEQPSEHAIKFLSDVPPGNFSFCLSFWCSSENPDTMAYVLSKFVSIPSVSSDPSHREDCRQAAIWLKKCLNQLGAESTLVRFFPGG